MTIELLRFNSATGQLTVRYGAHVFCIDVPIEDGAFLSGDLLFQYIRGFIPPDTSERALQIASASGADLIEAMCSEQTTNYQPSYAELRMQAYPPIADYMDAVVKGDQAAIDAYRARCLEVKAMYPKPEPVSAEVLRDRLGT